MKIYLGTDHNGYQLNHHLAGYLKGRGLDIYEEGDTKFDPDDDFTIFATRVVQKVLSDRTDSARGILICGSGQGMCMAANRFKGIRAALLYDVASARESRNDDDSNVACLPGDLRSDVATRIIDTWLDTAFAGAPRYKRRIHQLDEMG